MNAIADPPVPMQRRPLLCVENLHVEIVGRRTRVTPLRGVSFQLQRGEIKGLVGETGSGKSLTARSIMRLLPRGGQITRGHIHLNGVDISVLPEEQLRQIRGSEIGMIFQNPRNALHPLLSVEAQMSNVIKAHHTINDNKRREMVREKLNLVGFPDPDHVAKSYPHELSGGMAQRVVIATVLLSARSMIIADEPTTGLDVTVQRQILDLLISLSERLGLAVLVITHDLGIIAQYTSSVLVMHNGVIVEEGKMREVLLTPQTAYTRQLVAASRLTDLRSPSST